MIEVFVYFGLTNSVNAVQGELFIFMVETHQVIRILPLVALGHSNIFKMEVKLDGGLLTKRQCGSVERSHLHQTLQPACVPLP